MKAKYISTGMIIDVYLYKPAVLKTEENLYREKCVPDSCCLFYKESMLDFTDTVDWGQRRYEIAKEMLPTIESINSQVCFRCGKLSPDKEVVETAIRFADELINALKDTEK